MPSTLWARSDPQIPNLDVRPVCRGIANQSLTRLGAGLKATFEQCVKGEQDVREQLKREWPNFSAANKQHCVALATTGGESSNTSFLLVWKWPEMYGLPGLQPTRSREHAGPRRSNLPPLRRCWDQQPLEKRRMQIPLREHLGSRSGPVDQGTRTSQSGKLRQSEASAQRKFADAEATSQRLKEEAGFVQFLALLKYNTERRQASLETCRASALRSRIYPGC
jgi:hypothetical protein